MDSGDRGSVPLRWRGLLVVAGMLAVQTSLDAGDICTDIASRPDQCLGEIQKLSTHQGLDQALKASARLSQAYPDNAVYRREYAKLLYWKGQLSQAWKIAQTFSQDPEDRDLAARISIAYHAQVLKRLQHTPGKYLRYLHRIPVGEQESYDIKIMTVDAWVQLKRLPKALHEAKMLWHHYPKSTEAKALVATLYFWNKQYNPSLKLLRQLYRKTGKKTYQKQIHDVELARIDARLKRDNTQILKAIEQRDFDRAKAQYQQIVDAELAPRFDKQYPNTRCKVSMQHMAGAGVEVYHSGSSDRDWVRYVEGTFPVTDWIVYARAELIDRYGKQDHTLSAELYPMLPKGYWGYLFVSKTFDPDFSSVYAVGAHLYKESGKWQWGTSLNYSRYPDTYAVTVGGEYAYHLTDRWAWKQKLSYGVRNGTYSLASGFQYHTPCHVDMEINYAYATDKERIPGTTRYSAFRTHTFSLSGEYPVWHDVHLIGKASYSRNVHPGYHTDRQGLSVGVRTYW